MMRTSNALNKQGTQRAQAEHSRSSTGTRTTAHELNRLGLKQILKGCADDVQWPVCESNLS